MFVIKTIKNNIIFFYFTRQYKNYYIFLIEIRVSVLNNINVKDYHELNYWNNNPVYTDNSKYRYNNKIPIYQKSMQTRHYDRDNEGLRGRGSLINDRSRKYDLTEIEEGISLRVSFITSGLKEVYI